MHPFDIRTVIFAKHAQHVVLIHFPIALFITGVFFDFLAERTKNRAHAAAAYFNFLIAAALTVPVIATGLAAWQWALAGQKLRGILLLHLVLGGAASLLMWMVWLIHRRAQRKTGGVLPGYRLAVEAAAVIIVALAGHLGGFLSGVNGPG